MAFTITNLNEIISSLPSDLFDASSKEVSDYVTYTTRSLIFQSIKMKYNSGVSSVLLKSFVTSTVTLKRGIIVTLVFYLDKLFKFADAVAKADAKAEKEAAAQQAAQAQSSPTSPKTTALLPSVTTNQFLNAKFKGELDRASRTSTLSSMKPSLVAKKKGSLEEFASNLEEELGFLQSILSQILSQI